MVAIATLIGACSASGNAEVQNPNGNDGSTNRAVLPQVAMEVSPEKLEVGQSATIKWSSENATPCSGSGDWDGQMVLDNEEGWNTGPKTLGVHSYGLTCVGPGGSGSVVKTVVAGQTPTPDVTFQIEPNMIRPGDSAKL